MQLLKFYSRRAEGTLVNEDGDPIRDMSYKQYLAELKKHKWYIWYATENLICWKR